MRQNDLLKTSNGDHLRILLYGEEQSYVVNCQRCKMPFSVSTPSLLQMERLPPDMYRLFALDEDISDRQRQQRDHRAALISPLMVEECIYDKSHPIVLSHEKQSYAISGYTGFTKVKMRFYPQNALRQSCTNLPQTKRLFAGH